MFVNTLPNLPAIPDSREQAGEGKILEHTVTLEERFTVFTIKYPEFREEYQKVVNNISFKDEKYIPKEILKDRLDEILSVIERDYGDIEKSNLSNVFGELSQKIEDEFFAKQRMKYSKILEQAEKSGDENLMKETMEALHKINSNKHKKSVPE
jgi:hypothetical protein